MSIIGAVDGLLWGGVVRMFVFGQFVLSVNSICHSLGTRPYATNDHSRNNLLVAIPTLGEGWHNNHHAFPTSAYLGLRWWQLDVGAWIIRMLALLGLAWDVKTPDRKAWQPKLAQPDFGWEEVAHGGETR